MGHGVDIFWYVNVLANCRSHGGGGVSEGRRVVLVMSNSVVFVIVVDVSSKSHWGSITMDYGVSPSTMLLSHVVMVWLMVFFGAYIIPIPVRKCNWGLEFWEQAVEHTGRRVLRETP